MDAQQRTAALEAISKCVATCEECSNRAMEQNMDCWKNCRTCADLCGTTLRLTALNSQYAGDVAAISAKACESCAEICGKHSSDHCQACSQNCRECVTACKNIQAAYQKA